MRFFFEGDGPVIAGTLMVPRWKHGHASLYMGDMSHLFARAEWEIGSRCQTHAGIRLSSENGLILDLGLWSVFSFYLSFSIIPFLVKRILASRRFDKFDGGRFLGIDVYHDGGATCVYMSLFFFEFGISPLEFFLGRMRYEQGPVIFESRYPVYLPEGVRHVEVTMCASRRFFSRIPWMTTSSRYVTSVRVLGGPVDGDKGTVEIGFETRDVGEAMGRFMARVFLDRGHTFSWPGARVPQGQGMEIMAMSMMGGSQCH